MKIQNKNWFRDLLRELNKKYEVLLIILFLGPFAGRLNFFFQENGFIKNKDWIYNNNCLGFKAMISFPASIDKFEFS